MWSEFAVSYKDLGILVDTELKFHGHIKSIVGKSSGMSVENGMLENVQKSKMYKFMVLKILHIFKRLKDLDLFSVEGRLLRANVIKYWKIIHIKCGICPEDIFFLSLSSISRSHCFKIVHEIFAMDFRRRSFALLLLPDDVAALETLPGIKFENLAGQVLHNEIYFHFRLYSSKLIENSIIFLWSCPKEKSLINNYYSNWYEFCFDYF